MFALLHYVSEPSPDKGIVVRTKKGTEYYTAVMVDNIIYANSIYVGYCDIDEKIYEIEFSPNVNQYYIWRSNGYYADGYNKLASKYSNKHGTIYYRLTLMNDEDELNSLLTHALSLDELVELFYYKIPITYIPINANITGPEYASPDELVKVEVTFSDGYIYQDKGVSIYDRNGAIPFEYKDGTISFTMP